MPVAIVGVDEDELAEDDEALEDDVEVGGLNADADDAGSEDAEPDGALDELEAELADELSALDEHKPAAKAAISATTATATTTMPMSFLLTPPGIGPAGPAGADPCGPPDWTGAPWFATLAIGIPQFAQTFAF